MCEHHSFISASATLVCALMKGNPTLHLRKSKSTSSQEIPFSSCKRTDRQRVRGDDKDRQDGDRLGDTLERRSRQEAGREQAVWMSCGEHQELLLTAEETEKLANASPTAQSLLYSALNVLLEINFCDKKVSY